MAQHGFDINVPRESDWCTPLHLAIWQAKDESVAQQLIHLRADANARNRFGECASDLMTLQAPVRARLQGARNPQEILDIVSREVEIFDKIDCVTAYYRISQMLTTYNGQSITWAPDRHGETDLQEHCGIHRLRTACVDALTGAASAASGSIWATMMRALAMLPDPFILDAVVAWARQADLATFFTSWDSLPLCQVAWGIAKVNRKPLSAALLDALGNALSGYMPHMDDRQITSTAWAFAKAAVNMNAAEPQPHQGVFGALNAFLLEQGAQLSPAQSVSTIAWACAKVKSYHAGAFNQVAFASIRLMPTFRDQDVANVLWAFATMSLDEEELFAAAMQHADAVLYDDEFKNHVKISKEMKIMSFYQVYVAYGFCMYHFPDVLALLSGRLAADLDKIHRRDFSDGLSSGSGLETAEALRDLEAFMEEGQPWPEEDGSEMGAEPAPANRGNAGYAGAWA